MPRKTVQDWSQVEWSRFSELLVISRLPFIVGMLEALPLPMALAFCISVLLGYLGTPKFLFFHSSRKTFSFVSFASTLSDYQVPVTTRLKFLYVSDLCVT